MSVESWALLWKVSLVLSLLAFSIMAVVVTIGGAADIRRLLRRLRERTDDDSSLD